MTLSGTASPARHSLVKTTAIEHQRVIRADQNAQDVSDFRRELRDIYRQTNYLAHYEATSVFSVPIELTPARAVICGSRPPLPPTPRHLRRNEAQTPESAQSSTELLVSERSLSHPSSPAHSPEMEVGDSESAEANSPEDIPSTLVVDSPPHVDFS
jgi:hypothetical protein